MTLSSAERLTGLFGETMCFSLADLIPKSFHSRKCLRLDLQLRISPVSRLSMLVTQEARAWLLLRRTDLMRLVAETPPSRRSADYPFDRLLGWSGTRSGTARSAEN